MEIILILMLFLVFAFGLIYVVAENKKKKDFIRKRLGGVRFDMPVSDPHSRKNQQTVTKLQNYYTYADVKHDKFLRELYVAGVRDRETASKIRRIRWFSLIAPLVLLALFIITDTVTLDSLLLTLGLGGLIYLGITQWIKKKHTLRLQKLENALPDFMDLLVVAVESGMSFTNAVPLILEHIHDRGPLVEEFRVMHQEYARGVTLSEACLRMAKRCASPSLSVVAGTVIQSEKMGSSLADTLRILTVELRQKYRQSLREKAAKVPVMILLPSTLVFLALMIMVLGPSIYQLIQAFGMMNG